MSDFAAFECRRSSSAKELASLESVLQDEDDDAAVLEASEDEMDAEDSESNCCCT